jgi:hypothetical protein
MQAAKQCAPDCRGAAALALCSPAEMYEFIVGAKNIAVSLSHVARHRSFP